MKLIDMTCPHCGASLKINSASKECFCEYCGSALSRDDETVHIVYENAEESGYEFEKGRLRAQKEFSDPDNFYPGNGQKKTAKRKTWLWVLGWIFIFPVPLTILMSRNKSMRPALRYGIIVAGWVLYLLLGVFGGKTKDASTDSTDAQSAVICIAETGTNDTAGMNPDNLLWEYAAM